MTQASQQTHLSKLDLFTPSPLHPHLPPLATGTYPVLGGVATMLSTPDVLARSAYIRSLLGDKAHDDGFMRVRPATHDRIIKHLNIEYYDGRGWLEMQERGEQEGEKKAPKSMATRESRRAYAEKGLRKEWEALGVEGYDDVMWGGRRLGGKGKGKEAVGGSVEAPVVID